MTRDERLPIHWQRMRLSLAIGGLIRIRIVGCLRRGLPKLLARWFVKLPRGKLLQRRWLLVLLRLAVGDLVVLMALMLRWWRDELLRMVLVSSLGLLPGGVLALLKLMLLLRHWDGRSAHGLLLHWQGGLSLAARRIRHVRLAVRSKLAILPVAGLLVGVEGRRHWGDLLPRMDRALRAIACAASYISHTSHRPVHFTSGRRWRGGARTPRVAASHTVAQAEAKKFETALPKFPCIASRIAFPVALLTPSHLFSTSTPSFIMAPAPTTKSNKAPMRTGKSGPSKSIGGSKAGPKASSAGVKKSKKPQGRVSGEQVKSKSADSRKDANKKKQKVYTAKELGIPELNGIRPEGVSKPPNMKKGKNFVDDNEGMNAIMAMVMAEKEGNIESKMQKARHLEQLREAKKAEAEKRAQSKKATFEDRKKGIKESEKKKRSDSDSSAVESRKSMKNGYFAGFGDDAPPKDAKKSKKRVSFG